MIRQLIYITALATLILASCSDDRNRPADLIEEEAYIEILAELMLIKGLLESGDIGEEETLLEALFSHYGVTEEQYTRSHIYYQHQTDRQAERLDTIQEILVDERTQLREMAE